MEDKFIELLLDVFEKEDGTIKPQDVFREYAEWDSLNHLSLIAMLDDDYDVQIEEDAFFKIETIQQLMDLVKNKTNS